MNAFFFDPKKLKPNSFNPNKVSPDHMEKLRKSITDLGFVTSVIVRELPDGSYEILGGQHRTETAIAMGLKEIPVINVGRISDEKAKKIGLVDNARYGVDDTISLAKLLEEIGLSSAELSEFLPFSEQDFQSISQAVSIDLDSLDISLDDDDDMDVDPADLKKKKPEKTHDTLRFRVSISDAERIRQKIETAIKAEGFADDDELTAAGNALAFLLLTKPSKTEE